VGVYDHDADLVVAITRFLADALAADGTAVIVATPAHRAEVEVALRTNGHPVDLLAQSGRYVALDAADTLAAFMDADGPDATRFHAAIDPILRAPRTLGPVHLFGEMVALLWDRDEIESVLALESLWNDMADQHTFDLLCAYAMSSLESRGDLGATKRMCDQHSDVVTIPPATAEVDVRADADCEQVDRMFFGDPAALREVRRFVRRHLGSSLDESMLEDAEIVVSELATNALWHACSPFRVTLAIGADAVRISVRDAAFDPPIRRAPGDVLVGGRGIELVASLSRAWGTSEEPDGKTVWAELARTADAAR
jgi:anti-sigma regulatory factor (Ser/Thr protein kinase)